MKRNGSMVGRMAHMLAMMSVTAWSLMPAGTVWAAPTGADVQSGAASITQSGNLTTITASNGAIINYQNFNIGAAETVQFVQPDAASRVLNRITGSDPTHIDGSLLSNGVVYIVNPAGVYFGQGALVNVGGIYTGAAQLSNADFLAGIDHFTSVSGSVVNQGTINGSLVALIGQHVANYGAINAPGGMVTMVAGDDVIITGRDRHFSVRITGMGAEAQRDVDAAAQGAVENHGTIDAGDGKVVWGAGDVYAMGIYNDGTVRAKTVEAAASGSNALIGGTIDASSATSGGGDVSVTADHVAVTGTIDASGATGGGGIRIGGDPQGTGDLAHAQSTLITDSAYLLANAMAGSGGKVIVWSDGNTYFYGTIQASGSSGGGFVETSGHYLDTVGGSVIASGGGGTWLLDPYNTTLGSFGGPGTSSGGLFDAGNPNTWTASASPSQVDVADVVASLDVGTSVVINTAGAGGDAGNIAVDAAIAKTAGGDATLTLNADNNINVNAAISSSSNKLNVALNATGGVTVGATGSVATNGGTFDVASATYTGTGAVTTSNGVVNITTSGNQTYAAGAINAGSGDVALTTTGAGNINEAALEANTASEAAEIITTGHVTLLASGTGSIGSNPFGGDINTQSTGLFDIDAPRVDAQVTAGNGNIQVKDLAAGGVDVNKLAVNNGFVRFDASGAMTLEDNAVVVGNATPGAGFAWLVGESTIDAANPGNLVITTGPSANLRIDAFGDVGTSGNPLVLDTTGIFVLMNRGDFNTTGSGSFYGTNQRAGATNIVSMMIDQGDAQITANGSINISDFSGSFDTSFLGSGDLTLTSTAGGDILGPSAVTMNGGVATFTSANDIGASGTPIDITGAGGLAFAANAGAGNAFVSANTLNGPLANIDPTAVAGSFVSINSANTIVDVASNGTDISFNALQLPAPTGSFALAANSVSGDISIAGSAIVIPMTSSSQSLSISADAGNIALNDSSIDVGLGSLTLIAGNGAIVDNAATANAKIITSGPVTLTATTTVGIPDAIEIFTADGTPANITLDLTLDAPDGFAIVGNGQQVTPAALPTIINPVPGQTSSFSGFASNNFSIVTDGAGDTTVDGLTITDFPSNLFTMTFTSGNLTLKNIDASAATSADTTHFETTTGNIDLDGPIYIGAGTLELNAGSDNTVGGDITNSNGNGLISTDAVNTAQSTASVALTAHGGATNFGSVGDSSNSIVLAAIPKVSLDVDQDAYVDHDNTTNITALTLSADPQSDHGTPVYLLTNFFHQSYSGDNQAILAISDGSVFSLLINDARLVDGADANDPTHGTNYSFTAKTGNLYVDDDGAAAASPFDAANGLGNGGIFSGGGNVTLAATSGSVLPESPRSSVNIKTNADVTPHGPVVTVRANTSGSGNEGSIGGDGTPGSDNFLDISGSRRLVLDARDNLSVRGSGQPLELLDITVDPAGPGLGGPAPVYHMVGLDPATFADVNFDVTSDGTNLLIHNITSTHTFNPEGAGATEGTSLGVRARTGDIVVTNIDVLLQGSDPLLPRSVTLRSDLGSILLQDDAIVVGPSGGTPGNGIVRLNATNTIGEAAGFVNATPKVTTEGLLEMFANNQGAAAHAIGGGADGVNALDVSVGNLIAQAGMNLSASSFGSDVRAVQTGTAAGDISVFDRDTDAQGLLITNVDTYNGDVDLRSAGPVTLFDDTTNTGPVAIVAGNQGVANDGDVTVQSTTGSISQTTPASTGTHIRATGGQVLLMALGNVGGSGSAPLQIEAASLAGSVTTNPGGFFVNDNDADLSINTFNDALPGTPVVGITTVDGAIFVRTVGNMTVDSAVAATTAATTGTVDLTAGLDLTTNAPITTTTGAINLTAGSTATDDIFVNNQIATTTTPAAVTLTSGNSIVYHNVSTIGQGATTGGIVDTDDIIMDSPHVILDQAGTFLFRTATGSGGIIGFGTFVLSSNTTVDGTAGLFPDLVVNADGNIFFSGSVGASGPFSPTDVASTRLGSLSVTTSGLIFMQAANVWTKGGTQDYFGAVQVMTDAHYDDAGSSAIDGIHFHSTVDGFNGGEGLSLTVQRSGASIDGADDPQVPTISFADNVGSSFPLGYLRLNAYDADADGLFNNAGAGDIDGHDFVPTVATIVVANEFADGSINPDRTHPIDWVVNLTKDFSMGTNEKLTAIGSVTINANLGAAVTTPGLRLSDINADRALTLNANNSDVLLLNGSRTVVTGGVGSPDAGILYPSDANHNGLLDEFANDNGLDFWARDGIHVNGASSITAQSGVNPIRWYALDAGTISGTGGIGSTISLGYFPLITRAYNGGNVVLDLIPLDAAFNLGTIYPPPFPQLEDTVRLALTRHEFMNELLVVTRDAAGGERLRRALGNATFNDMTGGAGASNTVLNRIREDMVPIVLHTYDALFYSQTTHEDGSVESLPRFDQLRQTLADGLTAYRKGTGQAPTDPVKFRTYFEQTGESPETLATLNALKELYLRMAQLGLTDREWSNALFAVTARITPQGTSPDLFVMAALGQPYATASAQ